MVEGTQLMEPPAAQFYKHRIGEVELIALSDRGLNYPTAMIFGNVPPEGASRYTACPRNRYSYRTPFSSSKRKTDCC